MVLAFTDSKLPKNESRREKMLSIFLPVIKSGMEKEFLSIWKRWFVTEDTVDDEKFPGKLKSRIFELKV